MSALASAEIKTQFKAMGTEFEIICAATDMYVVFEIQCYAHELERLWTRFNDSSELMQLNLNAGKQLIVSSETAQLVDEMRRGFYLTGGLFNAGVLPQMQELGFGAPQASRVANSPVPVNYSQLWGEVVVEENAVCLPVGLSIDAGGIGKGLAADLMANRAMNLGAQGIVINAGGEVAVRGESVNPHGWSVGIENPFVENEHLTSIELATGGLATSAPSGWIVDGNSHIVNPQTGDSVISNIAQATVLAARTVDAEVLAKMCLLMPINQSLEKIDELGAAAFIVDADLQTYPSANWSNFQ